ncbi:MAG: hypothetical protein Tsb0020_34510 [Haliangiales bacterium]
MDTTRGDVAPAGLMRWLLVAAIRGYRRWLSGRGPLRAVRCSFERSESCSAYGLRVARDSPSALAAARQIRARIRRCGQASLYRVDGALTWGDIYDRAPDALFDALARARELPVTQAAVMRARAQVAGASGHDADRARALSLAQAAQSAAPSAPRAQVVVRSQRGLERTLRRQRNARLLRAMTPLCALVALTGWLSLLPALLALALAVRAVRAHARAHQRIDRIIAARAFSATSGPLSGRRHRASSAPLDSRG